MLINAAMILGKLKLGKLYLRKNLLACKKRGARLRSDWSQTAINLAFDIANYRSEDPYTQVGACAVHHCGLIGLGYNGPPEGIEINWRDRKAKNERVLHAEENVLNRCLPGDVLLLAVTHMPCKHCIKTISQKKIKFVFYSITMANYEPNLVKKLAREFGIKLIHINPTTKNALFPLEYTREHQNDTEKYILSKN